MAAKQTKATKRVKRTEPIKNMDEDEFVITDSKTYFDHGTLLGPMFGLTKVKATRFKTRQECYQEMADWPVMAIGIIKAVPASKPKPKLGKPVETDAKDRILLEIISKEGPIFMKGAHNEHRAYELTRKCLLKRENGVYSIKSGGEIVEWRNKYTITAAGLAELYCEEGQALNVERNRTK